MQNGGLIRACTDVYRIGKMEFSIRRFCLSNFLSKFKATQKYQQTFAIHTYYLITNNSNLAWLINYSDIYCQTTPPKFLYKFPIYCDKQVGGFMQVIDKTFIMDLPDFALVPAFMYPKNEDFSFLNLQTMFMWMSSYPKLICQYGLRPTPLVLSEENYIKVDYIFEYL